jgi:hypothetical protein
MTYFETGNHLSPDNYKENLKLLRTFRRNYKQVYNGQADMLLVFNSGYDKNMIKYFQREDKPVVYANHMMEFKDEHPEYFL